MDFKIKTVGAYHTPDGVVADSVSNPKYAEYRVESDANTYLLYATSDLTPLAVTARIAVDVNEDETLFMNGFRSDSDSREAILSDKMTGLDAVVGYARGLYEDVIGNGDPIERYKDKPGVTHGFSYCYFRSGDRFRLFASLDESTGYTVFRYDAPTSTLHVFKDIEGVEGFNNYKALALFVAEGSEDEVFDKWFAALGKSENLPAPALVGYTTKKLEEINEDRVCRKITAVKTCFPEKPNAFILEGEYCKHGDWLSPCEVRFPIGLREISDSIKAEDMMSGLCISPLTVSADSDVFEEHPDWLVRRPDGKLLKVKKDLYVLDLEIAEVREYIRNAIHTILYMWGFDIIKLDNLFVASLIPSAGKSRGQKACEAMSFLRECCGGKLMYADHAPLMPAFKIADYCAVSCDAISNNVPVAYARRFHREGSSVRNASADIVYRRQLNQRAFLNAPCPVSLDDKEFFLDGRLNNAEQNVLTNLEGLFTSVIIMSDSTAKYGQKKKRRFKRMCALGSRATDIKVAVSGGVSMVSYRYEGKVYVIQFR